ncbi:MAG TPA: DinB family protein [Gemmatimonadales bacterium]|nr:DinB family protein [Gemmatimonadales bacterium]
MTIGKSLLPEFDQETAITRRVLERVPDGKGDWKPHPKSFSLAHLSQLVSGMPGWMISMLKQPGLDLAKGPGYSNEKLATLLQRFDQGVAAAREALSSAQDSDFDQSWALMHSGHVITSQSRREVIRTHFSHMVHHRAQLGMYLRLLDVPVPSMYGPTADERFG